MNCATKLFAALCLGICALANANDDLMAIKSGIREINGLLFLENGRKPLKQHLDDAQVRLEETIDLFVAYKLANPFACHYLNALFLNIAKRELLPEKPDLNDANTVFLG